MQNVYLSCVCADSTGHISTHALHVCYIVQYAFDSYMYHLRYGCVLKWTCIFRRHIIMVTILCTEGQSSFCSILPRYHYQWRSKVLGGPCAEIWWWVLELVYDLKQNKMGA